MAKIDKDATWKKAKEATGLKVFLCKGCDAVHFLMLDETGNVIAFVDTTVGFYEAMVDDVNTQVSRRLAPKNH